MVLKQLIILVIYDFFLYFLSLLADNLDDSQLLVMWLRALQR